MIQPLSRYENYLKEKENNPDAFLATQIDSDAYLLFGDEAEEAVKIHGLEPELWPISKDDRVPCAVVTFHQLMGCITLTAGKRFWTKII